LRRADRLFQIVQLLRRDRLSTAAKLARELRVSERTIYRDIQDLTCSGVPIEGEAGVGYALPRSFDLPPLMFTVDELEALVAGARVIQAWADPALREAARTALGKVEAVVPEAVRARLLHSEIHAPDFFAPPGAARFMGELREALRDQRKVAMRYRRGDGQESARVVLPLGLFFWGYTWSLVAWCEWRGAFRTFRLDRVLELTVLPGTFEPGPGQSLAEFLQDIDRKYAPGAAPEAQAPHS
jgi:predicted DNA-binding transcriptional regulator YafY